MWCGVLLCGEICGVVWCAVMCCVMCGLVWCAVV